MAFTVVGAAGDVRRSRSICAASTSTEAAKKADKGMSSSVRRLYVRTPLVYSDEISAAAGRDVLLKMENIQPSGSFKIRGIGHLCLKAKNLGTKRFVSSSGGNAGAAVAYAGKTLGVQVVVCVPSSTPDFMRKRLSRLGAKVIVEGNVWSQADELARELSKQPDSTYISPFDDADIWEGHSTIVDEIKEDLNGIVPSAVTVSVGGGGLLLGICRGLEKNDWLNVTTIAAETEGAASFAATFRAKELVDIGDITSIAKSLGASRVSESVLPWLDRIPLRSVVVSDREAVEACGKFAVSHRYLVEPACGATLAIGYGNALKDLPCEGPVVLVVCGGNIATPGLLVQWAKQTGASWNDLA
eukprot:Plantae.Rhodophyta-Purpureofilum_apyrenoidigerum.ctg31640.p1 GENE.Plantae.Rhodophyta-Purpureofilum_apyrenoidigerum.ctg31640~~Plantae.Rhodophyta-Purpureofilum_apyrenoidigerum.ctg31640.p1  ORF type:complete len:357 (-),score=53.20 Plantae.Rhodophyta-Purpureofilum_apyrenoidigerum.ctg31640:801-1871(-)